MKKQLRLPKPKGEARTIEMTTKAKNDALVATAKANAQAIKTKADAESYRVNKLQDALSKAGDGYFRTQSLDSFNQLAQGPDNLIVVGKDEMTNLGKVPVIKKVWDQSKSSDND